MKFPTKSREKLLLVHAVPLAETAAALRSGSLKVEAYLNKVCDRIESVEPLVKALLPEPDRRGRLLRDAAALKARFPEPGSRPPLYGILVGVKDIFHVDGFLTRAGSDLPPHLLAGPEASCVRATRDAGALILGKTVTTEFAYFEPGPTRNPHNLAHTPGGSSSGSAAAVAAGFCPLALGTQTSGSVIRPAAFCGIVGYKPSFGRIPTTGLIPLSESADHVGLFSQNVDGITLATSVLCNDWEDCTRHTEPSALPTLGVLTGPYLANVCPGALTAFKEQLCKLKEVGYSIQHVEALQDNELLCRQHGRMIAAEAAQVHAAWFVRYSELYHQCTAELIRQGRQVGPDELATIRNGRATLRIRLERIMKHEGIDLWIGPAAPGPAPKGIDSTGDPVMNSVWTHAGMPAITIPAGLSEDGLPLGLQLVAPFMADEKLLAWIAPLAKVVAGAGHRLPDATVSRTWNIP